MAERFVSQFRARFDAKGRISVPAPFRAVLEADGHPGLFVHPALDVPALDCGGRQLLGEIDALLARFSPYSEERDAFATALLGTGDVLKMDPEGRIALPERFKVSAGLSTEAVFVGQGVKFQIWEPTRFEAHLGEAKARLRAFRASLSGSNAASAAPAGARE